MKTKSIKSLLALVALSAVMFFSSCQDDNDSPSIVNDPAKVQNVQKLNAFREDLSFIKRFVDNNIPDVSSDDAGRRSALKTTIARIKETAPCADITEEELQDGSVKITMNFGEGCQTEEGIEVAGKVIMVFHFNENTFEFELEFIDYTELNSENANEIINGTVTGSFLIDLESGEFVQEMEQDLSITSENDVTGRLIMQQTATLTENGMEVNSMSTSGNLSSGEEFSITVTKALLYDFGCEGDLPVQGEERVVFQGNTIVVNYGDGTCDDDYAVK
ncbi:MAG TPA: hypothetical protein VD927_12965 [Chryseosolibacter sp.]|nr:hypothetical protein [Chryseosolibacter sp.]